MVYIVPFVPKGLTFDYWRFIRHLVMKQDGQGFAKLADNFTVYVLGNLLAVEHVE